MSYYWVVKMSDRKEYRLSEAQFKVLREAVDAGKKTVIFDRFVIGLPFIQHMDRHRKMEFPKLPR